MFLIEVLFSILATTSWAQSNSFQRFDASQLTFHLSETDGSFVSCTHKPLESVTPVPPPPWWVVTCNDRKYTVDIWMETKNLADDFNSVLLLYHAKESVSSSGENRTRFETQTTEFFYFGDANYKVVRSSIDVRNGLADLYVTVTL